MRLMITMASLFASALLALPTIAADEPTVPAGDRLTPMLRASVFVHDLDESLKLYQGILGLKTRVALVLDGNEVNTVLGTRGKTVHVAILQSGDTRAGNVGLFSYNEGTIPEPVPDEMRTGDVAFVFVTDDIRRVYAEVVAAGYKVISPPMVLFPSDNPANDSLEMLFFDRDGIAINLIQRPQEKPKP